MQPLFILIAFLATGCVSESRAPAVLTDDAGEGAGDASAQVDAGTSGIWVLIVGGTFQMGSTSGDADEQPVHAVTVPSFEFNRTEVTVAQYRECLTAGS